MTPEIEEKMKITSTPTGAAGLLISDAVVLIDEYHREYLGMDFLGDNCEIIEELESREKLAGRVLAIVDSRPEFFADILSQVFSDATYSGPERVWCVFPKNHADLMEWILRFPELSELSIRDYVVTEQVIALNIGEVEENDLDARGVLIGMDLGLRLTGQNITGAINRRTEVKLRQQLISLIESLDLVEVARENNGADEAEVAEKEPKDVAQFIESQNYTTTDSTIESTLNSERAGK